MIAVRFIATSCSTVVDPDGGTVRTPVFGTLNNAFNYFQTSFNIIIVVKYEHVAGYNRPPTQGVITNYSSGLYSIGFSVCFEVPNSGTCRILVPIWYNRHVPPVNFD